MTDRQPYGSWASPITAAVVAAGSVRIRNLSTDGDDVYWVEARPAEHGRLVLVRWRTGHAPVDVTPSASNVRSRVHEYGGAAYAVADGTVYYVEFADQCLYRLQPGSTPVALTPSGASKTRYADCTIHPSREWLVCIRESEDHTAPGGEAENVLVAIDLRHPNGPGRVIVSGHDFYSTPRFSPDGSQLAWLAWRHPHMPWDGTELWLADVSADGQLLGARCVAGGDEVDAIFQPGWSPDGVLYFVSERTGWWNLYRTRDGKVESVCPVSAECGRPQWELGTTTWTFVDDAHVVVAFAKEGRWGLGVVDTTLPVPQLTPIPTELEPAESLVARKGKVIFVGRSSRRPDTLVQCDLHNGSVEVGRVASTVARDERYLSPPEAIRFPTDDGRAAHAFFYAPYNATHTAPPGEKPPLIVVAHGGPTAAACVQLNLEIQYWTSRGFAVVDVNYGGSTGYGRDYRQRLDGQWGVVDVNDCVNAAKYLVSEDKVDGERLIVRGRSAGGYVTLAALAFHPKVFSAGASYYGIGDIEAMARDTHKFESRYFETLIGPYPESQEVFRARSPIHAVEQLSCPLILFQGLEDRVVPPEQSKVMAEAVAAKGLPVALLTFEGEQHGFRKSASVIRCLEAELFFYGAVFGFTPADDLESLRIDNLPSPA